MMTNNSAIRSIYKFALIQDGEITGKHQVFCTKALALQKVKRYLKAHPCCDTVEMIEFKYGIPHTILIFNMNNSGLSLSEEYTYNDKLQCTNSSKPRHITNVIYAFSTMWINYNDSGKCRKFKKKPKEECKASITPRTVIEKEQDNFKKATIDIIDSSDTVYISMQFILLNSEVIQHDNVCATTVENVLQTTIDIFSKCAKRGIDISRLRLKCDYNCDNFIIAMNDGRNSRTFTTMPRRYDDMKSFTIDYMIDAIFEYDGGVYYHESVHLEPSIYMLANKRYSLSCTSSDNDLIDKIKDEIVMIEFYDYNDYTKYSIPIIKNRIILAIQVTNTDGTRYMIASEDKVKDILNKYGIISYFSKKGIMLTL